MEFGTAAATAPVAAYFMNPRLSNDVLSSAIGALRDRCNFRSRSEFPFWHSGWRISYTRPALLSTGVSKLVFQNSLRPEQPRALEWGDYLTAGRPHSRTER